MLCSLETGERRRITNPDGGQGDSLPRFSPDGRSLAFARASFLVDTDLYVVALDGGEERRLTEGSFYIRGLDWARDGQSIVFSSMRKGGAGRFSLWQAWLSGGAPELLEF